MAQAARETLALDRVLFVPAARNPLKEHTAPAEAAIRLRMLEVATSGDDGFTVIPSELNRPAPSFTIDTIHEVKAASPDSELFLLIGADNLATLDKWHRIHEILAETTPVILRRPGHEISTAEFDFPIVEGAIDISSTLVRNRVARGLPIRYMVPEEICDIIQKEQLYRA